MRAPPRWLFDRPLAHRGLHDGAEEGGRPENSLAAFQAAVTAGYGIELDVQASADGRAMVFHDSQLARMTGRAGLLAEWEAAALAGLTLRDGHQGIPTLDAALQLIGGQVPVIVEIKTRPGGIGLVEQAALPILRDYQGPFAVTAFEARSLTWFRQRQPDWPRGHNVGRHNLPAHGPWWRRLAWRFLYDVDGAQPDFVVYDGRDLPNWASGRVRAAGTPVLSYTIKDRAEMDRLAPHTDNIIFEGFRP